MALVGERVEIPAHFDLWMAGARYGAVVRENLDRGTFVVRLDRVPREITFTTRDLHSETGPRLLNLH